MSAGNRILGAMTLVNAESGRVLDEFDLKLAEQVADRAAVAIENARLYSKRSSIAHTLQQSLLPEQLPQIPGFELAACTSRRSRAPRSAGTSTTSGSWTRAGC